LREFEVVDVSKNVFGFVVFILWLKHQSQSFEWFLTIRERYPDLWVEHIKTKSGQDVTIAFDKILKRSQGRQPQNLQTDDGKEFYNKYFQALC